MELKDRIREAMEAAKLKPLQFAKAIGVSSGCVTHWLNGATASLKAKNANRMQQVTGYSANWLITGLGEKLQVEVVAIPYDGPSQLAQELALVFDMIPYSDQLKRTKAYSLATASIVAVLEGEHVTLVRAPDQKN